MTTIQELKATLKEKNNDYMFSDSDDKNIVNNDPQEFTIREQISMDGEGFYLNRNDKPVRLDKTLSVVVVSKTKQLSCYHGDKSVLFTTEASSDTSLVKNIAGDGEREIMPFVDLKSKYVQLYGMQAVKVLYCISCVDMDRDATYAITLRGSSLFGVNKSLDGFYHVPDRECPFQVVMTAHTTAWKERTFQYITFKQDASTAFTDDALINRITDVSASLRSERDAGQDMLQGQRAAPARPQVKTDGIPQPPTIDPNDIPF